MREDSLKRFGIDARLDDVQAKTEHIKVVCEGESFSCLARNALVVFSSQTTVRQLFSEAALLK